MKMDWKANTPGAVKIYDKGTYLVKVDDWEYIEKNNKTFAQWFLKFEGSKYNGETICRFDTMSEKALWTTGTWLNACGIDTSQLPPMDTQSQDFDSVLDMCVGRRVWIHVEVDETRGRNSIDASSGLRQVEEQKILVLEPNDLAPDNDVPDAIKKKQEEAITP